MGEIPMYDDASVKSEHAALGRLRVLVGSCLGFRVHVSRSRVEGLGFRAQGLGLRLLS